MFELLFVYYLIPVFMVLAIYEWRRQHKQKQNKVTQKAEFEAGLSEPVSLHPIIDPGKCLGCQACIMACPEGDILGLVHNKVELINPTHCIGHGACQKACPFDAIDLVFGTKKRGVDIPLLTASFETNVSGIYIAGELGGMGLIRNAVEQGRQAVEAIAKRVHSKEEHQAAESQPAGTYDLIIVGVGPAGFAASLTAKQRQLKCLTLEQECLGGALSHYPRRKVVMTHPVDLPMVGKMTFRRTTKETLLEYLKEIEARIVLPIRYKERLEKVERTGTHFTLTTNVGTYTSKTILLTIGRRGTPRKLGVKGEDLPKVVYQCIEPEQYQGLDVLVVGGGNSALESALALAETAGTTVGLSYRRNTFAGAHPENVAKVFAAQKSGRLQIYFESAVKDIVEGKLYLDHAGKVMELKNDAVVVCAGGELPFNFLRSLGIQVATKFGTR